ncbi:MAG: NAD(P)H-binding protein [Pseudomonadota bacterium]
MKLTIFGATGTVGTALIQDALAKKHDITALVRSPAKISAYSDRVNVVVGDYFDADARARALEGAEAVLTTIGPPMKRAPNNGEYQKAMTELIGQMQNAGIQRIVAVGGAGLRLGNEELPLPRRIMRLMLRLLGAKGIGTRNKSTTRCSHRHWRGRSCAPRRLLQCLESLLCPWTVLKRSKRTRFSWPAT